jgi:hypothetical protein
MMRQADALGEAGFRDIGTGRLGRTVQSGVVFVPSGNSRIWVDGPDLCIDTDYSHPRYRKVTKRLLDDFISLWQSPDEAVAFFARQWGGLRMDDRGRIDASPPRETRREPLSAWRFFSRRAYAILRIAADLNRGKRGSIGDWRLLSSSEDGERSEFFGLANWLAAEFEWVRGVGNKATGPISVTRAKGLIAGEVSEWMQRFGTAIRMEWGEKYGWHLEVFYSGRLLAAIALQLSLLVANADSLHTCFNPDCAMPLYIRKRGSRGASRYCPDCGKEAALRIADQRRRERMREARCLHAEGMPAPEIADRLKVRKVATVRSWIKKGK